MDFRPKIEEFSGLVHKLSVILTALQYKPQWKMGVKNIQDAAHNDARTVTQIQISNICNIKFIQHDFSKMSFQKLSADQ